MRVRAVQDGDLTEVKILMKHRMLSRLSWNSLGQFVLPHFIQTVRGYCNDKQVLYVHVGGSVARDPYFSFKVRDGKKGDRIVISWIDTEGVTRTDETIVT